MARVAMNCPGGAAGLWELTPNAQYPGSAGAGERVKAGAQVLAPRSCGSGRSGAGLALSPRPPGLWTPWSPPSVKPCLHGSTSTCLCVSQQLFKAMKTPRASPFW